MIVYKYDENGIYTGETTAQESPREPSMYLMPPNTTAKIPPEIGDHECAIFGNESWDIKPDYRDVTYWLPDGSEHHITEINVIPPNNALFEKPVIPPTFDEAKTAKLAEINAACDSILNAATASYPASEVLTFDQQTKEAELYQADNTASIPLLSALSASRNIPLPELAQRVLAKHHAFSVLSGVVIGQRQALEDALETCTTVEQINALKVNIILPEANDGQTA